MKPTTKKIIIITVVLALVAFAVWAVYRWRLKNDPAKLVDYVARKQKLTPEETQLLASQVEYLSGKVANNPELKLEYETAAAARKMTLAQYIVWSAAFVKFPGDLSDPIGLILGRM